MNGSGAEGVRGYVRDLAFTEGECDATTGHIPMRLASGGPSEWPRLMQGGAPRSALLESFRRTPHAVLFATASFWQGVDVPGNAVSCVVIGKVPLATLTLLQGMGG